MKALAKLAIYTFAVTLLLMGALFPSASAAPPGFDQALQNYRAGHYAQALAQFQSLSQGNQADPVTHYYMGLCYHNLNQRGLARQEYQWVAANCRDPYLKRNAQAGLAALGSVSSSPAQGSSGGFSRQTSSGAGRPKVLDFNAKWCGPCKKIAPLFRQLESQYRNIEFVSLDIDEPQNQEMTQRFSINAVPTFIFMDGGGRVVNRIEGADPDGLQESVRNLAGH